MTHLPALQIIVPLLAAPGCIVLRRGRVVRWFATGVTLLAFVCSILLTRRVLEQGSISYHLGGWEPPWGIELRADAFSALVSLVVTGVGCVVSSIGIGERSHGLSGDREAFFYAAYLLCLAGLIGMTLTGDAFNAFVFLEISSLSSYTLIALGASRRALTAAFSYLMLGTVGGTFFLLGVGLLYQLTGTLNMADLAARLPQVAAGRTLPVAACFLFVGLGLKVAIFPLHQWLPNAYAFAPSPVSAFLAGTATKVSFYLFARFVFGVVGAELAFGVLRLGSILLPLSLAAMFVGALAAIYQTDFKRLLAYSSVSQLGYMTLALSLNNSSGLGAGLLHLFNHATIKAGLFLASAAIVARVGSAKLANFRGLGRRMPLTMSAVVVGGLGLIGVPGTSGFVSKWLLVRATLESGYPWLAFAILASSLLAVAYVWKVIELSYFGGDRDAAAVDEPASLVIAAWSLAAASLFFGIFPEFPLMLCQSAVEGLLGGLVP